MHGLLFDLGGTFLRSALTGSNGSILCLEKTRIASVADGLEQALIWQRITHSIVDYEARFGHKVPPGAPIVISFPGPIANGCRVLQAPTVAGADGGSSFDLPAAVREATGRPVTVLNDVSAAAWHIAGMTAVRRFLVVTVSSGIGSKLFDRCHPAGVIDEPPYAGEIGHVVVDDSPDAPLCDCGARGHLGAIASGRGIERIVRRQWKAALPFAPGCERGTPINNEQHIVPAFLAGDAEMTAIVRTCTRPLVRALLTVAMAAGLERVFIMGGFANALGEAYLRLLHELACEMSCYQVAQSCLDTLFQGVLSSPETSLEGCAAFLRNRRVAAA